MSQTTEIENVLRLKGREIDLLNSERQELKRRIALLSGEIVDLKQVKHGDDGIEIGLHELYIQKLKKANRFLDDLTVTLRELDVSSSALKNEGHSLSTRLESIYGEHRASLFAFKESQDKTVEELREDTGNLSASMKKHVEQVQSDISTLLDRIVSILTRHTSKVEAAKVKALDSIARFLDGHPGLK